MRSIHPRAQNRTKQEQRTLDSYKETESSIKASEGVVPLLVCLPPTIESCTVQLLMLEATWAIFLPSIYKAHACKLMDKVFWNRDASYHPHGRDKIVTKPIGMQR